MWRRRQIRLPEAVGTAEFELLSTVELKKILKSNDEIAKQSIAAAASAAR